MTWRIIGDDRFRAIAWAKEHFRDTYPEHEKFTALISEFDGDIRGVVFYTDWYPTNSIDMHIAAVAGERWLTRPFLAAAFGYPFLQLNLRRVTGRIAATNERANRFVEKLGFVREGLVRQGWHTGDDLVIWGMLKSECRFLGSACYRQTFTPDSSKSAASRFCARAGQPADGIAERGTQPHQPIHAIR